MNRNWGALTGASPRVGTDEQQRAIEVWADAAQDTNGGTNRLWIAISVHEMAYMLSCTGLLIVVVGFTVLAGGPDDPGTGRLLCLVALIINAVFAVYFIFRAIRGERPHEFICFLVTYSLIVLTSASNAFIDPGGVIDIIVMVISLVSVVPVYGAGIFYTARYIRCRHLLIRTLMDRTELEHMVDWVYRCKACILLNLQIGLICVLFGSVNGVHVLISFNVLYRALEISLALLIVSGFAALGYVYLVYAYRCIFYWLIIFAIAQLAVESLVILTIFYSGSHDEDSGLWQQLIDSPYPIVGFVYGLTGMLATLCLLVCFAKVYCNIGSEVHLLIFKRRWRRSQKKVFDPNNILWYGTKSVNTKPGSTVATTKSCPDLLDLS